MLKKWLLILGVRLLRKVSFRTWTELEDRKFQIVEAVEQGSDTLSDLMWAYVSTALHFCPKSGSKIYWKDVATSFLNIHSVTVPKKSFPLVSRPAKEKNKKDPWDYSGRIWFFYSNIIASEYGWSIRAIANLSVEDALAYIQEILTERHLEKEFVWSTSQIAYPYNKVTKKSKFSPLPRPYWMTTDMDDKKRKVPAIPKSLLPVGNVVNLYDPKTIGLGGDVETVSPSKTSN